MFIISTLKMSKLSKFLELHGSVLKENESGSSYYQISDRRIRVPNHLTSSNIPDQLSILLPENSKKQYIVVLMGKLYIHDSYTSLRVFLETWMVVVKGYEFKQSVLQNDKIAKLEAKLIESNKLIAKLKKEIISPKFQPPVYDFTNFNDLTKNQKGAVTRTISIGLDPTKQIADYQIINEQNRLIKLIKKKKK